MDTVILTTTQVFLIITSLDIQISKYRELIEQTEDFAIREYYFELIYALDGCRVSVMKVNGDWSKK